MRKLIEPIAIPLIEYAARSYVCGPRVEDAIELAEAAREIQLTCTLCYWNDGKEDPAVVAERYIEILDQMAAARLDGYLAVKIPALLDSVELTQRVVEKARRQGTRVVFDSHAPAQSTTTFQILERIGGDGVGCAIPGRWRRSLDDVERAIELGSSLRIVKGQWADPEDMGRNPSEGYMRIIERVAGRGVNVGVATHDVVLAEKAIERLVAAGTACEQEVVFPLPADDVREVAQRAGLRTRLYIPYGKSWLPYSISRTMKNPKIMFWLLRDLFMDRRFKLPLRASEKGQRQ